MGFGQLLLEIDGRRVIVHDMFPRAMRFPRTSVKAQSWHACGRSFGLMKIVQFSTGRAKLAMHLPGPMRRWGRNRPIRALALSLLKRGRMREAS
jgi:hypothetical protein